MCDTLFEIIFWHWMKLAIANSKRKEKNCLTWCWDDFHHVKIYSLSSFASWNITDFWLGPYFRDFLFNFLFFNGSALQLPIQAVFCSAMAQLRAQLLSAHTANWVGALYVTRFELWQNVLFYDNEKWIDKSGCYQIWLLNLSIICGFFVYKVYFSVEKNYNTE